MDTKKSSSLSVAILTIKLIRLHIELLKVEKVNKWRGENGDVRSNKG